MCHCPIIMSASSVFNSINYEIFKEMTNMLIDVTNIGLIFPFFK